MQGIVGRVTRVCSYDHAGYAWSQVADSVPRSTPQVQRSTEKNREEKRRERRFIALSVYVCVYVCAVCVQYVQCGAVWSSVCCVVHVVQWCVAMVWYKVSF